MTYQQHVAQKRRLRRRDASEYLKERHGLSYTPQTLAKLAVIGGGPEMEYAGRFPLYSEDGLDEWAAAKFTPPVRSTSERRAQQAATASRHERALRPEASR
jgi:hypothetical protein